jgi:hypothetical protein
MPLGAEVCENVWKIDPSIRAIAESVFREWREDVEPVEIRQGEAIYLTFR